jgi:hypothetical protein
MDLPHQLHHHAAKRRRLDEVSDSWGKPTEKQTEEHHPQLSWPSFYQASSDPCLTSSAMQQNFLAPESRGLLARPNLNTVSSGFKNISILSDFNGQLSSQASQFYETHGRPGGDTYETQPTATGYQTGPCSHIASTYSRPLKVPTPPPASWLRHAVYPQLVQAQSPVSVPIPCHPYSVASFQAPRISQQSSEPPSVKTIPTFIPVNEIGIHISDDSALSLSALLDKDQSEMVCFGMVSTYMVHHKSICADICRSRPSPLSVSGKIHVKFHHRFQSK